MYKQLAVALLALTMTLAVPVTVSADDDCSVPEDATVLAEEGYYVTDDPAVFEETNGEAGLQINGGAIDCNHDGDTDDDVDLVWSADASVL